MKKIISKFLLVLLVFCLILVSCDPGGDTPQPDNTALSSGNDITESVDATEPDNETQNGTDSSGSGDNTAVPPSDVNKPTGGGSQGKQPTKSPAKPTNPPKTNPPPQPDNSKPLWSDVKKPVTGNEVESNSNVGESSIDYSNVNQGYVMMKNSGASGKLLAYVVAPNGIKYNYPLASNGQYVVCPLQGGNGKYTFSIMENLSGNQYRAIIQIDVNVSISNANLPYLYPSVKVNFDISSACVKKSSEITRGMSSDVKKIEAIYSYITNNITYDSQKAATVQQGYTPDPDRTLREGKGICWDYAVLFAAMLRSQGIPCKMIEGNVSPNNIRHAWNQALPKDKGTVATITFGGSWTLVDTTYGAAANQGNPNVGDGKNYKEDKAY